jgi:hypothetical protein
MTSLINPSTIDITFPIAGQDNDTQGFRTNYQNIRNNFIIASQEISALQANVSSTFTSNLTVQGNLITTSITTPANSSANLIIDPDGNADVVVNANNLWLTAGNLRSTASTFTIANLYPTTGYILGNASAIYMGASTGNVIVGSNLRVNSSITVVNGLYSLTGAIQFANLTTAQVNAISTPARGMTVYNYNTGNIQVYNGTKWANVILS